MLIVHVNQSSAGFSQELVEEAVRNYFAYRARLNAMEFKRVLKQGRTSLVIGLLFLGGCFLLREVLLRQADEAIFRFMRESLMIAGWVAMWRPMQIFLYDWWPLRHLGKIYERLSRMPVELRLKKGSVQLARSMAAKFLAIGALVGLTSVLLRAETVPLRRVSSPGIRNFLPAVRSSSSSACASRR